MAMFTAYFDASGNAEQSASFIVVAGYIANVLQWRSLEIMWDNIHKEAGVNKPFHMSEFMAAATNPIRYAAQKNARPDSLLFVMVNPGTRINSLAFAQF
jgi:hypothetical protein